VQDGVREFTGIDVPVTPIDPGVDTDTLQAAGIPVPENYSAPSYGSLQESMGLHLQAARLGDLLLVMCSCEQWAEQTKNIKTRTDLIANNIWVGWDWARLPGFCTQNADTTWTCKNPGNPQQTLPTVTNHEYRRMRAQINNDAKGWNDTKNVAWAESEPVDPAKILGNFTHVELPPSLGVPGGGYRLTMTLGMANDYNGYIASYREYQRGDHYRKALTGWGAHSSDYIATRLVQMGGFLRGGPALKKEPLDAKEKADQMIQNAKGKLLGLIARTAIPTYEALLPNDGGTAGVSVQPADITRFQGNHVSWIGGSNYTDNPFVRVQRLVEGEWQDFANQSGEIITTLEFPKGPQSVVPYLRGNQQWVWTAHFEAFSSVYEKLGHWPGNTPPGQYRYVIDGQRRRGGVAEGYHLKSKPFDVSVWKGITAEDLRADAGGVSLRVGPSRTIIVQTTQEAANNKPGTLPAFVGPIDYPDSYATPLKFIKLARTFMRDPAAPNDPSLFEWYCFKCTFRPWVDAGQAREVIVTVVRAGGSTETIRAKLGEDGLRWRAAVTLAPGDRVYVEAGDVRDPYGNINGSRSATLTI
ncbi:MAG: hypothetical protein LC722_07185, partial [Actinobacteria bacterium]|nr:hypothetical protein [Actinomycetota bacterium]